MKRKGIAMRSFVAGIVFGALLFGTAAYAASGISVDFLPIKFVFDGIEKKLPTDQSSFVYQGRTYVPLRFVSESLGKEVSWDGASQTAYIGKQPAKTVPSSIVFKNYQSEKSGFSVKVPSILVFSEEITDDITSSVGTTFAGPSIMKIGIAKAALKGTSNEFLLNSEIGVAYMKADSGLSGVGSERIKIGNYDGIHITFVQSEDGHPWYTDIYAFMSEKGLVYELRFKTLSNADGKIGTPPSNEAKEVIRQAVESFKITD